MDGHGLYLRAARAILSIDIITGVAALLVVTTLPPYIVGLHSC